MAQKITKNQIATQESWATPSYVNGWVDFDTSVFYGAKYMKDSLGFVHLRGLVKSGTATNGTPIFTLPAGYRPEVVILCIVSTNDVYGRIDVYPNGNVQTGSNISSAWASLNNITFKAA